MRIKADWYRGFLVALFLLTGCAAVPLIALAGNPFASQTDTSSAPRDGAPGMGGFIPGARGVLGTVTEVTADHFAVKTQAGEIYTVHFSANTRMMKQPPAPARGERQRGERPQMQPIHPTDIHVGDAITAGGELDEQAKSIGAVFIVQLDPARAAEMRAMEANYGKTWLAGRITAINETNITILGMLDHVSYVVTVDENTSFRERRDSVTLADLHPGQQLRVNGAPSGKFFAATLIHLMPQRRPDATEQTPPNTTAPPQ
uniref:DUF5666 domain-containing protein n=1 Tax=mine drainage metagenome TaxID=410659 RepID=E6PY83_9ZZZZ